MEFEEYDFTRNPVVQNQVFFRNRNVPPAVCQSWCTQLKSWSNTKGCTERNVGRQTPLHNVPYRPREGRT
jgi:hypothetical protein